MQRGGRPRREGIEGRLEHGGLERGLVLLSVQLRRVARLRGDEEGQVSPTPSTTPRRPAGWTPNSQPNPVPLPRLVISPAASRACAESCARNESEPVAQCSAHLVCACAALLGSSARSVALLQPLWLGLGLGLGLG